MKNLFIILFIVSFVVAFGFMFERPGFEELNSIFSVASFLFGIFIAFSIANAHGRLQKISEPLKDHDALLLSLFTLSSQLPRKIHESIQKLIDTYLIAQLDFYLTDFRMTQKDFQNLIDYTLSFETKNEPEQIIEEKFIDLIPDAIRQRKQVESLIQQPLTKLEWVTTVALLSIILACLFFLNNGSLIGIFSTFLMSVVAVLLLVILWNLDSLKWKEQSWVWGEISELFENIGCIPYYPDNIFLKLRQKSVTKKSAVVRVAEYPNHYPDMKGKIIKEVSL